MSIQTDEHQTSLAPCPAILCQVISMVTEYYPPTNPSMATLLGPVLLVPRSLAGRPFVVTVGRS